MQRDLVEILVCPVTKEPLDLVIDALDPEDENEILQGHLYSKSIDFKYPIEDGIPNLLPPEMQQAENL
ncbi:MAG: Trm112 family protein [Chloroflexi bacterium]|nr:Trm112 family protein [Chloroflexota bacterium]